MVPASLKMRIGAENVKPLRRAAFSYCSKEQAGVILARGQKQAPDEAHRPSSAPTIRWRNRGEAFSKPDHS
jgi:hypothetical protein